MIPNSCPTFLNEKRSSWKRFSIGKSSSQPIRLSILKLDGTSFEITVTRKATVAKLKQAVEAVFGHLPTQGDSKIWSHVWGNFCLCFEHMKLLRDRDPITRFGIKSGDQLQFVRHTPIYIVAGERSECFTSSSNEGSSSKLDLCGDMNNKQNHVRNEGRKDLNFNKKCESNWGCTMKGLFKHRRQEGRAKGNGCVVKSTVRLGQHFPCDDAKTCKSSSGSNCNGCGNAYLSNSFCDYLGGFGYPTGYCLK
ncbi:ubiquitin-related domain-containing protein [Artemisia annua]|uniref:Ubiquitin-related domain-containing protein n=1 Tax=Artemisia annua TaxID=35608 RepID=A0A2U1PAF0_ARTAN|nr:ubiquitin-related domain-containing protein [Artemisia annua]